MNVNDRIARILAGAYEQRSQRAGGVDSDLDLRAFIRESGCPTTQNGAMLTDETMLHLSVRICYE